MTEPGRVAPAPAGWLPWAGFAAAVLVNLVVVFSPSAGGVELFTGADRLVHVAIFALVAASGRWAGLPAGPLAGLLMVHAGGSELVQHLWLPHRSGDPVDAAADVLGVLVGLAVAGWFARRATRSRRARAQGWEGHGDAGMSEP